MLLVVFLFFFGVTCLAFPTSEDGAQCLARCFYQPDVRDASEDTDSVSTAEHNRGHSVFKRDIFSQASVCEPLSSFRECSKQCPRSRVDVVAQRVTLLAQKQCSDSVPEEQQEMFFQSAADLFHKLRGQATPCEEREPKGDEALCKNIASCLLGSTLDELKNDYPKDVATSVADWRKAYSAWFLKDHISPPE
ncbi:hypothetical protein AAVH_17429 [Aphelenchoides avenae]|nr:hypothetical protein AAVH_17429 [Aphelenchus avenae]